MAKPRKVKRPRATQIAATLTDQKPTEAIPPKVRYVDMETARPIMEKIMQVHHNVLRRLAEYERNTKTP